MMKAETQKKKGYYHPARKPNKHLLSLTEQDNKKQTTNESTLKSLLSTNYTN